MLGDTTRSQDDGGFAPVDPALTVQPTPPSPAALPAAPFAAPVESSLSAAPPSSQPSSAGDPAYGVPPLIVPAVVHPTAAPSPAPPLPPRPPQQQRTYLYAQGQPGWAQFAPAPPAVQVREPWSRRRKVLVTVASVAAGAVLVTATAAAGLAVRRSRTASQEQQAAVNAEVQAQMPRLEAFVAKATGRPWTSTPVVRVLDDAAFVDAMHSSHGGGSPTSPSGDDDDAGVTAAAMGLAPDPDAFWDAGSAGNDSNVTGFYDDSVRALYVRGSAWAPIVEITVVHELTHANQDQSFDLAKLTSKTRTDDESWNALQAVIEGEATLVERDYAATKSQSWQSSVEDSDSARTLSDVPIVDTEGAFPYEIGSDFVAAVREAGGTSAVSRAFTAPPRWSRDLLHPKEWLAGSLPAVVLPMRPDSPSGRSEDVSDIGVLGVEGLWLAVDAAHPRTKDFAALEGWVGDSYSASENDNADTWCFVDDVQFTSEATKKQALDFLAAWTDRQRVQVTQTSPTAARLRGCQMG